MDTAVQALSTSEALVLQQLGEFGEEELSDMAKELREPRDRIMSRLTSLKRKGLVRIHTKYGEIIVSLTQQGRQAIHYLWPEAYAWRTQL